MPVECCGLQGRGYYSRLAPVPCSPATGNRAWLAERGGAWREGSEEGGLEATAVAWAWRRVW